LVDGRPEGDVATPTSTAFKQKDFLACFKQLMDYFAGFAMLQDGAKWHLEQTIRPTLPMLISTTTGLAILGFPLGIEVKGSEISDVVVGHHANVSPFASVAAVGATLGNIFFTQEADATIATLPCFE
jgi:hypothetical protein